MNFLSHYYFERYSTSSERVTGCLLPDLLKHVGKSYAFQPLKHQAVLKQRVTSNDFFIGWMRHVDVDRVFHGSDLFLEHRHNLRKVLGGMLIGLPIRPSFLAHISIELLLDFYLLKEDLINPNRLYEHLAAVDKPSLRWFLDTIGNENPLSFMEFYDTFVESKYLLKYVEIDFLAEALLNICKRVWNFQYNYDDKMALSERLLAYYDEHEHSFHDVFTVVSEGIKH